MTAMFRALLALATVLAQTPAKPSIAFEVRAFDGTQEVTSETRGAIYRAGERTDPVAQVSARGGRLETAVAPGIYDLQLMQERAGRILNIRWAERLVVMQYPDEAGHHLEVVNFKPGQGALEVRSKQAAAVPDVALYAPGVHNKEVAIRFDGPGYALFVVPSGKYDILLRVDGRSTWT